MEVPLYHTLQNPKLLKLISDMTQKLLRRMLPAFILAGGLWTGLTPSYGKPEYTRKEKQKCVFCHVSDKSYELNEAGKYYREHGWSLKGYQPPTKK
jgi:hypothetical protein